LKDYRYIGFGSTYFSDIRLVHKRLGINDIVSIEKADEFEERFEYNKPFDCVEMMFEKSTDALPKLDWSKPTILWLDYEGELIEEMMWDIQEFMTSAVAGSVIFITINADPGRLRSGENKLERLKEELPADMVPNGLDRSDLRGWDYGEVCRKIILNQINEKYLDNRNAGIETSKQIKFKQLVNYKYEDGAKMRTIGGILHSDEISEGFRQANFEELEVVEAGDEPIYINPPKLTFKEMRGLDEEMPNPQANIDVPITPDRVEKYERFYRYFPRFRESEL
jgi:hypothetical protein